ncbi:MAG: hypothetical protein HFE68_01640 [Erysipelotrichaceae bacterium]|nr:hypothetical protein [Erysipelotrichaceae bacterium]
MITDYTLMHIPPFEEPLPIWHKVPWLDGTQLMRLFPMANSRFKRHLRYLRTYRMDAQAHTQIFSLVKQRKITDTVYGDWIYQVRCYDPWWIETLLKEFEAEAAHCFLNTWKQSIPHALL